MAVLLAACESTRDQAGNLYPPECRGALTCRDNGICDLGGKSVFVRPVPRAQLPPHHIGVERSGLVLIADDVTGWRRDDLIRHEACHWIAGNWHPGSEVK